MGRLSAQRRARRQPVGAPREGEAESADGQPLRGAARRVRTDGRAAQVGQLGTGRSRAGHEAHGVSAERRSRGVSSALLRERQQSWRNATQTGRWIRKENRRGERGERKRGEERERGKRAEEKRIHDGSGGNCEKSQADREASTTPDSKGKNASKEAERQEAFQTAKNSIITYFHLTVTNPGMWRSDASVEGMQAFVMALKNPGCVCPIWPGLI
eukprot:scaffold8516_cov239-Pinguiococcus_pyrenoidosus.AAC.2